MQKKKQIFDFFLKFVKKKKKIILKFETCKNLALHEIVLCL